MTPMRFADTTEEQKRYGEFIANGQVWESPSFMQYILVMASEPPGWVKQCDIDDLPMWIMMSTPYRSTSGTAMMVSCDKSGKWLYTKKEIEHKLVGWKLLADVGVCIEEMERARLKCLVSPDGRVVEN